MRMMHLKSNMARIFQLTSVLIFVGTGELHAGSPEVPVCFDDRFKIELIAQEPDIVTPTGVAVDARGCIFVVENNTHEVSKSYKGHPTDRIQIFEDFGPDGRAKKISTFA